MKLYHGTHFSAATNIFNNGIDLSYSKLYLDFGPGFYTTQSYDHAARCAIRTTKKYNEKNRNKTPEEPYVVELNLKIFNPKEFSIKMLPRHSEEWGNFVLNNRLEPELLEEYTISEHNQDKKYDICYGEIADGSVAIIAHQVNRKEKRIEEVNYISFLKDTGEVYPTQYSFHTDKILEYIEILSCSKVINQQKYLQPKGRR